MEELVDSVLAAANPKLRERCDGQKILSVFDTIGIYDVDGVRACSPCATTPSRQGSSRMTRRRPRLPRAVEKPLGPASSPKKSPRAYGARQISIVSARGIHLISKFGREIRLKSSIHFLFQDF
jgi:hypothetical protein